MIARLLLLLVFIVTAAIGAERPPLLQDQYGASIGLSDYSGKAVLAIIVSGRKLRLIERWEKSLRAELPTLRSVRIADITDEPRPTEAQVAMKLRERVPENVSILIDLQNHWSSTYALDTKEPCLLLFDAEHSVVAKFRGRPNGELVNEVLTALSLYFPASQTDAES